MASANPFVELLGETLLQKVDGTTVSTAEALAGKIVGLYFSAHWCPPCRGFTPELINSYQNLLGTGRNFQIVFVSSDKDEHSFNEYYGSMPWLALPFADRSRKAALSKKYKVQGIPTLVLLNEEGQLITSKGREEVSADPEGADFPWAPKSLTEILGTSFLKGSETVGKDALAGKVVGIYFSAHWCPPCRGFTPELIKTYNNLKAKGKNFEIIFASSDRDAHSFAEYYGSMPWLAIPFEDRGRKTALSSHFEVEGIPTLVILDENLQVINANGRNAVFGDSEGNDFPWFPKPVNDLSSGADGLNDETCLLVLMENADPVKKVELCEALEKIAKEYIEKAKTGAPKILFFTAVDVGDLSDQIRRLTALGEATENPDIILLDIPDNGGFYKKEEGESDETGIRAFLQAFEAKSLTRKQLSRS